MAPWTAHQRIYLPTRDSLGASSFHIHYISIYACAHACAIPAATRSIHSHLGIGQRVGLGVHSLTHVGS